MEIAQGLRARQLALLLLLMLVLLLATRARAQTAPNGAPAATANASRAANAAGLAGARMIAQPQFYPDYTAVAIAVQKERLADDAIDTPPVIVAVSGNVRDTTGRPVPGAVVELVMNPYRPSGVSTTTSTVVDENGEYLVVGQGHHGSAVVKASLGGALIGLQTYWSIRKDQRFRTSFRLQVDPEGRVRIPNLYGPKPKERPQG